MANDPKQQAQELIERLHERGHHEAADQLARRLSAHALERGLLIALREACETLLTAIEAIDPVMQTMIEKLRVDLEKQLSLPPDGLPQHG